MCSHKVTHIHKVACVHKVSHVHKVACVHTKLPMFTKLHAFTQSYPCSWSCPQMIVTTGYCCWLSQIGLRSPGHGFSYYWPDQAGVIPVITTILCISQYSYILAVLFTHISCRYLYYAMQCVRTYVNAPICMRIWMLLVLIKCMHTACTSDTEECQQLMAMKCKSSCVRTDIYSYVRICTLQSYWALVHIHV